MRQARIKPESKKENKDIRQKKRSGCVIVGLILLIVFVLGVSLVLINIFYYFTFNQTPRMRLVPPTITPIRSVPVRVTPTRATPTQVILICDECEQAGLGINVWSRKGTGSRIAFTVPNRTVVDMFSSELFMGELWYRVEHQGRTGWTLGEYVHPYSE